MSHSNKGNITPAKTVKAGCGIRYDPDELGEDTGFDFSNAVALKEETARANQEKLKSEKKPSKR